MSSTFSEKVGYLRDRVKNAWGQLRRGEFRAIVQNLGIEFGHRAEAVKGKAKHHAILTSRAARLSAMRAQHRLQHMRAGGASEAISVEEHFDLAPPEQLIPDSAFRNRRKLVPPSEVPTTQRLYTMTPPVEDAQVLLKTLTTISNSLLTTQSR
jgi:hypothetical protein